MIELEIYHGRYWPEDGRRLAVESFPNIESSSCPSAPLVALEGQCQDLGVYTGIGQCLDVVWCSGTHTLVQTS